MNEEVQVLEQKNKLKKYMSYQKNKNRLVASRYTKLNITVMKL
jgi:hypothetical protein